MTGWFVSSFGRHCVMTASILGFTLATLESRPMPEAMALFHLPRDIGSSFFISVCVAEIVRATAANDSRLTEMIAPFDKALDLPRVMGAWTTDTTVGLARLAKEINRQSATIGYSNAFAYYTGTRAVAMPPILLARKRTRKSVG